MNLETVTHTPERRSQIANAIAEQAHADRRQDCPDQLTLALACEDRDQLHFAFDAVTLH